MTREPRTGEPSPRRVAAPPGGDGDHGARSPAAGAPRDVLDPAAEAQAPRGIGTFHAFRYGNYRLLWVGDVFTAAAQWVQQTTVSWVVYDITGSGSLLGAINLMRVLPTLLFSPPAGVATDRVSRNRIIAVSQLAMLVFTLLMALDLGTGRISVWHLFLFTFLVGSAQTFNMPARQTFVFDLVPRHVIPNAVALSWLAFSLARSIGPAVGGLLIVHFGPANNFYLQSAAYFTVLLSVSLIRNPLNPQRPAHHPFFRSLREGYGFAFTDPRARLMVVMSTISPLLIIPLHAALLPIFAKNVFHGNASALGVLAGSLGFGGLFGGLLTASLNRVDRRGLMQMIALLIFAGSEVAFSILAYLTGDLTIAVPLLVVAGCAESLYSTTNTSVLQLLAPEHLRGSMAAVLQLSFLLMPIGGMVAGSSADLFGAPAVGATITAIAFAIGLGMLVFSSRMRNLRLSELVRAQPA